MVRISGILREFLGERVQHVPTKQGYQERIDHKTIAMKNPIYRTADQEIGSSLLTWSYFKEFISNSNAKEAKKMEANYHRFIKIVQLLHGDQEASSDLLKTLAMRLYDILINRKLKRQQKVDQIFALIKNQDKDLLNEALQLAISLEKWKVSSDKWDPKQQKKIYSIQFENGKYETDVFNSETYTTDLVFQLEPFRLTQGEEDLIVEEFVELREQFEQSKTFPDLLEIQDIDEWLSSNVQVYLSMSPAPFSVQEMYQSLLDTLISTHSDEELQETLLNLLGMDSFEFIEVLLKYRTPFIAREIYNLSQSGSSQQGNISIQSTTQNKNQKLNLKKIQKLKKLISDRPHQPFAQKSQDSKSDLDHYLDQMRNNSEVADFRPSVPPGTVRKDFPTHVEYTVPVPKGEIPEGEELLSVDDSFDNIGKLAFKGFKTLNRIQSKVYNTAYNSNENMLICAPTGAGKTNIALMTMIHEIKQHITNGALRLEDFKIIYVTPMKALAAEMTENFSKRLMPLNISVKELTGDMQLTKREIKETQVIITTPEKWDVITRKSSDNTFISTVRLLIIDEVHLLHEERGSVIESLVARTLRLVEQTQQMIRIVGLSATLPNYKDVAQFLRVNEKTGLFYFDGSYRPVPLSQMFIGVKGKDSLKVKENMLELAFKKVENAMHNGKQSMIFVHSRKDTVTTCRDLIELIRDKNLTGLFFDNDDKPNSAVTKEVSMSKNVELKEVFPYGFAFHHAGMLRSDRNLVENLFREGHVNVLVCTATLAWGVNLPAHTVIIKGTKLYNPEKGGFVDLGISDVMQIFGRAGRPQYDTSGEGIIITHHNSVDHYVRLLGHQAPIESQFIARLPDHLNAEIVLGTVSNVQDALQWLSYTYLFIRLNKNPLAYGITLTQKSMDPSLRNEQVALIRSAARTLDRCKMIRFDQTNGNFYSTDFGRIASHFYVMHETVEHFNEYFKPRKYFESENDTSKLKTAAKLEEQEITEYMRERILSDTDVLDLISQSVEFKNIVLREEEMDDLKQLEDLCVLEVKGGPANRHGKVNILIQTYISKIQVNSFSLISDMLYISQNASRITRAVFEIAMRKNWPRTAYQVLRFCKMIDHRLWVTAHPLRQFNTISPGIMRKLEDKRLSVDRLLELSSEEIGGFVNANKIVGKHILSAARFFPSLDIQSSVQPLTRTVLKVILYITADFTWNDKIHGTVEPFWIWIEDTQSTYIYHSEYFLLHKNQRHETHEITVIVPIEDPPPSQYQITCLSDRWLAAEQVEVLSFEHLIFPHEYPPNTELLNLYPLSVKALQNPSFEALYPFPYFNPIQTQTFHTMYYTDTNALVGAPTGSGKTIVAEFAMLKLFRDNPKLKVVYIAPLKALVRERMKDWKEKFDKKLGKKLVELTGDYTPDVLSLMKSDIITTTPEKWDGISRNWKHREYVKSIGLLIIDEIHLLGEERGPILEVIVSRMRFISTSINIPIRIVGLSTALSNAINLADWLGIDPLKGLYNFKPSVRPVPVEVHITGFRGKHYCPRMATMNKPAYNAIRTYSPNSSVLIFVSSRRQTRVTALDLISLCGMDDPKQFLHMDESELENVLTSIKDTNLQHTLSFGIGLHHGGLTEDDKSLVEDLFRVGKIRVLVSTATLAWGVNLPAHLVIIKGTEFYDAKTKRYKDFPITDVLQMMGRAGRPQFDREGYAYACIFVEESKKNYYTKFLYDPFPVESSLHKFLHDHINAEIVSETIQTKQDAVNYLTWTYFFRRMLKNPSYYELESTKAEVVNQYLSVLMSNTLFDLEKARCIVIDEDEGTVKADTLGRIAAFYYLHYKTMEHLVDSLVKKKSLDLKDVMHVLCHTQEYRELPVRHNEDKHNAELSSKIQFPIDLATVESPHTKAFILLQCHFDRVPFPVVDFYTDTKSVLDQAIRILQAMVDVCAEFGELSTAFECMHLQQMCVQGEWLKTGMMIPHMGKKVWTNLRNNKLETLQDVLATPIDTLKPILKKNMTNNQVNQVVNILSSLPKVKVQYSTQIVEEAIEETRFKVNVTIQRSGFLSEEGVFAPRFPKRKDEGWWIAVGVKDADNLLALRKLNTPLIFKKNFKFRTSLSFILPSQLMESAVTLYLVSDCFIGLDHEEEIKFERFSKGRFAI